MAIIDVKEDWADLSASEDPTDATAPRAWTVSFDSTDDPKRRPLLALRASAIPALYQQHPYNALLWVQRKDVQALGPFLFKVFVHYGFESTQPAAESIIDPYTTPPLDMPWEIEWGFVTYNERIDRDINDDPIVNSAGQSFDPPIMREFHDLLVRIRRNEAAYDPLKAWNYKGAKNADNWWRFGPGHVLCTDFSGRHARSGNMWYWQVSYAFQMRWIGWKRWVLDEGLAEKTGVNSDGTPKYKICEDERGIPMGLVLLDNHGRIKKDTAPAEYRKFDLHRSLPFSALGLGLGE